jgi:hypothetical protein
MMVLKETQNKIEETKRLILFSFFDSTDGLLKVTLTAKKKISQLQMNFRRQIS